MDNTATTFPSRIRARVTRTLGPRRTVDAQNAWNLYADIAWYGILFGIVQSFLAVFTIRLGGSDTHVGLISSLPALVTIFASIPGSWFVERERKPLSVLLVTGTLHRAGFLAIALVPIFVAVRPADAVIVLIGLLTIPAAMANVAFTTMFGYAVKPHDRPHVVSVRNVWIGITSTATALLGGRFLDLLPFPLNYQLLFAFAFVTSLLSIYYLSRIQIPARTETTRGGRDKGAGGVRGFIAMLRAERGYVRFTIAAVVAHLALLFAIPLYSIYLVRYLHASEGWIGLISMVGSATTIFFFPIWGRIAARYGNHPALIASIAALAGYPLFMALTPSVEWMLFVSFWGGAFTPGFSISIFNGLLEVCPEQNRSAYIATFNTLINIAMFAVPLVSSSLTGIIPIQILLLIAAGLRLLGAVAVSR